MNQSTQRIIRNKIGLLNLAEELGNVSKACQMMGVSRDTFYRYQSARDEGGVDALLDKSKRQPNPKNRVEPVIEQAVLMAKRLIAVERPDAGERHLEVFGHGLRTPLQHPAQRSTFGQRQADSSTELRQPAALLQRLLGDRPQPDLLRPLEHQLEAQRRDQHTRTEGVCASRYARDDVALGLVGHVGRMGSQATNITPTTPATW